MAGRQRPPVTKGHKQTFLCFKGSQKMLETLSFKILFALLVKRS